MINNRSSIIERKKERNTVFISRSYETASICKTNRGCPTSERLSYKYETKIITGHNKTKMDNSTNKQTTNKLCLYW